jgi:hypothetical protein
MTGPASSVVLAGFRRGLDGDPNDFSVPFGGGRAQWVTIQPIGEPGAIEGILCYAWDQSDARRTEEELARRLAQQSAVARFGELALQNHDVDALQQEACRLVAATLDVDLVYALEHVAGARMLVRGGHGWDEGMVGSEIEVTSFAGATPGSHYADGAVVIDDLPSDTSLRGRPLRAAGVISAATVLIG